VNSRSQEHHRLQNESILVRQPPRKLLTPNLLFTCLHHQGDQRQPHDSGRAVDPDYLQKLGVIYHSVPDVSGVDEIATSRNYKNRDEITVSPEKMGDIYEDKVKSFFHEHLHEDEEIRYILDGAGYFDVRNEGDEWVRIWLEKGDLIILPSGIYHRFTTDEQNVSRAFECRSK
jgi:cupin superfamily acireductone dioxygenase involved in methionine salvage